MAKVPALKRRKESGPKFYRALHPLWLSDESLADVLRTVDADEVCDLKHLDDHVIRNLLENAGYVEKFEGDITDLDKKEARWLLAAGYVTLPEDKSAVTPESVKVETVEEAE